jgi:hypothetical protein
MANSAICNQDAGALSIPFLPQTIRPLMDKLPLISLSRNPRNGQGRGDRSEGARGLSPQEPMSGLFPREPMSGTRFSPMAAGREPRNELLVFDTAALIAATQGELSSVQLWFGAARSPDSFQGNVSRLEPVSERERVQEVRLANRHWRACRSARVVRYPGSKRIVWP